MLILVFFQSPNQPFVAMVSLRKERNAIAGGRRTALRNAVGLKGQSLQMDRNHAHSGQRWHAVPHRSVQMEYQRNTIK